MGNFAVFFLCIFTAFLPFEMLGALRGLPSVARLLGGIVLAACVLAVVAGHRLRPLRAVVIMQIVFVAWAVLTWAWTMAPDDTQEWCVRILLNLIFAILVWEFAVTYGQQRWILRSFLIGLLVPLSLTLATFAGFYHMDVNMEGEAVRLTGGGNDQNYLAMILSMGIVMAIYFATTSSGLDRWLRPFYWTFSALAAISAMLTGSRGGLVCLVLAAIYGAFLAGISPRRIFYSVAVLAFIVFVVVLIRVLVPAALQERVVGLTEESGRLGPRLLYWQRGLTVTFPKSPVVGVGLGGFRPVTTALTGTRTDVAHNMLISNLVELGIVGLLIYLSLWFCVFRSALGFPRREKLLWLGICSIWFWESMLTTLLADKLFWLLPALLASQAVVMVRPRAGKRLASRGRVGLPVIGPPRHPRGGTA